MTPPASPRPKTGLVLQVVLFASLAALFMLPGAFIVAGCSTSKPATDAIDEATNLALTASNAAKGASVAAKAVEQTDDPKVADLSATTAEGEAKKAKAAASEIANIIDNLLRNVHSHGGEKERGVRATATKVRAAVQKAANEAVGAATAARAAANAKGTPEATAANKTAAEAAKAANEAAEEATDSTKDLIEAGVTYKSSVKTVTETTQENLGANKDQVSQLIQIQSGSATGLESIGGATGGGGPVIPPGGAGPIPPGGPGPLPGVP